MYRLSLAKVLRSYNYSVCLHLKLAEAINMIVSEGRIDVAFKETPRVRKQPTTINVAFQQARDRAIGTAIPRVSKNNILKRKLTCIWVGVHDKTIGNHSSR